jgi:hypothetical protein
MTVSIKICIECHYAECRYDYAECRYDYAECRYDYAECRYTERRHLYFAMLSVVILWSWR